MFIDLDNVLNDFKHINPKILCTVYHFIHLFMFSQIQAQCWFNSVTENAVMNNTNNHFFAFRTNQTNAKINENVNARKKMMYCARFFFVICFQIQFKHFFGTGQWKHKHMNKMIHRISNFCLSVAKKIKTWKPKQNFKHERKIFTTQMIMVAFCAQRRTKQVFKIDEEWKGMIYNTNKNINKVFNKLYQHFQTYSWANCLETLFVFVVLFSWRCISLSLIFWIFIAL